MKIYLIRHGETTGDIEGRFGGYYDDHLTEKGKEQARELGTVLQSLELQVLFYSPRIRTKETVEIILETLPIPTEKINDLRERNMYGVITGLTEFEAQEKFPQEFLKIKNMGMHHDILDSESYESFSKRVFGAFEEIRQQSGGCLGIIAHGGVIGVIMRDVFKYEKVSIGDCGIIEIEYTNNKINIKTLYNAKLM